MESTQTGKARIKYHQADTLAANAKLEEAERSLFEARKMAENVPAWEEDFLLIPNILSSLSLVQKRQGRHDRVLNTLKSLLKLIIEKQLSKLDHAVTLANIGTTLLFLGKLDISLTYTLKANKMIERLASPSSMTRAANDGNHEDSFTLNIEEKRRLIMNQVPACYNLAIIYQKLGCTLESNKCLNAAKSLAISKIGFNNKITDLVTKNVELRSKEGKPVFLTQRFVKRNQGQRSTSRGPSNDIVDVEREVEESTLERSRYVPESGGKMNYDNFRNAMTLEDDRPQMVQDRYGFKEKLPRLNQPKLRNQMLRNPLNKVNLPRQYIRPQTDNSDWTPTYDANYPQAGMPKMASGGRPMSNGDVCGVRVTKLPPIYQRPFGMSPFSEDKINRVHEGIPFPEGIERSQREPTYDLLRIHSSKSRIHESGSLNEHQNHINMFGRPQREYHSLEPGQKTPNFDVFAGNDHSFSSIRSYPLKNQQSGNQSKKKIGQSKTLEYSPNQKSKDQPLIELGHFGFSKPVNEDKMSSLSPYSDAYCHSTHLGEKSSTPKNDSLIEANYRPNIYSSSNHEPSQTRNLNINRLQINMRYLS